MENRNHKFVQRIRMTDIKNALKRMNMGIAVGLEFPLRIGSARVMWVYAS